MALCVFMYLCEVRDSSGIALIALQLLMQYLSAGSRVWSRVVLWTENGRVALAMVEKAYYFLAENR